jgi:hypothetical protein
MQFQALGASDLGVATIDPGTTIAWRCDTPRNAIRAVTRAGNDAVCPRRTNPAP